MHRAKFERFLQLAINNHFQLS